MSNLNSAFHTLFVKKKHLTLVLHRGSYIMGHYKAAYCQLMKDSIKEFFVEKNLYILYNKIIHQYLIYSVTRRKISIYDRENSYETNG